MTASRRFTLSSAFFAALTAFVLAGFGIAPALAQSKIVVVVNEEAITSFDVQNRYRLLRAMSGGKIGERQALEQLIDERLMLQEAKRRNVVISDEEVEAEFARRAANARYSPAQFEQAMRGAGIDPATFKSFIRANMAWSEIVRVRFRGAINISEQEVARALQKRDPEAAGEAASHEYMLQQILFVGGSEAAQRSRANAFRSQFQGCDHSLQQVAGATGVVVKPTVRREEGQISAGLRKLLEGLEVGGITQPEATAEGIQLVAICAMTELRGHSQASEEVRDELASEEGEMVARRYLRDLRADAVIDYR